VTLGAQDDGQILESVPSPWGSHAILLVTIDGKYHWIDTTVSLAPWDYLPRDDRNRMVYVTDSKGLRLMRTPRLTAAENRTEQTTLVTVAANGTSTNRRKMVFHGVAAVTQRETWSDVPAGERRRLVAALLQDSNSRAHLRRLTVQEKTLRSLSQDVVAGLEFDIPGHFTGNPELEGSVTDSKIWGKLLGYTLDYDRRAPLDLGTPFESVHNYIVRLPAALRFESLPKDLVVRSKWGTFQLAVLADRKDPRLLSGVPHAAGQNAGRAGRLRHVPSVPRRGEQELAGLVHPKTDAGLEGRAGPGGAARAQSGRRRLGGRAGPVV
jgi:hypothetical protein